jgi:hypothetical protein
LNSRVLLHEQVSLRTKRSKKYDYFHLYEQKSRYLIERIHTNAQTQKLTNQRSPIKLPVTAPLRMPLIVAVYNAFSYLYENAKKGTTSMHGQYHWQSKLKYLFDSYAHPLLEKTVRILLKTSSAMTVAFA